ncbi:hypothetical protein [Sorangium sp. Soce836]|uniref:hypothetical protein n=1 Tax=Sorangium sp. So ce836 TaxID=2969250 RepID=UPI002350C0B1|nr:hypothetical protein [Sorangium sp. Soce836]
MSTTSCAASGRSGKASSQVRRTWARMRALASSGEARGREAASSAAPHGRTGAVRSTAGWQSQLFAEAMSRPGTSPPRRRACSPMAKGASPNGSAGASPGRGA